MNGHFADSLLNGTREKSDNRDLYLVYDLTKVLLKKKYHSLHNLKLSDNFSFFLGTDHEDAFGFRIGFMHKFLW